MMRNGPDDVISRQVSSASSVMAPLPPPTAPPAPSSSSSSAAAGAGSSRDDGWDSESEDDDASRSKRSGGGGGIRAGGVSQRLAFEPSSALGNESPYTPAPTPLATSSMPAGLPPSLPPGGLGSAAAAAANQRAAAVAAARRGSAQQSALGPPSPGTLTYRELLSFRRRVATLAATAAATGVASEDAGGPAPLMRALSGLLPPNSAFTSASEVLSTLYSPEVLLRPDEFARVFEVPLEGFSALPPWQRLALKKKLKLAA